VMIAIAAVQAPRHMDGKAEAAASVGLVAANLRHGRADPNALVRLAPTTRGYLCCVGAFARVA
jgi:hypothetical protein